MKTIFIGARCYCFSFCELNIIELLQLLFCENSWELFQLIYISAITNGLFRYFDKVLFMKLSFRSKWLWVIRIHRIFSIWKRQLNCLTDSMMSVMHSRDGLGWMLRRLMPKFSQHTIEVGCVKAFRKFLLLHFVFFMRDGKSNTRMDLLMAEYKTGVCRIAVEMEGRAHMSDRKCNKFTSESLNKYIHALLKLMLSICISIAISMVRWKSMMYECELRLDCDRVPFQCCVANIILCFSQWMSVSEIGYDLALCNENVREPPCVEAMLHNRIAIAGDAIEMVAFYVKTAITETYLFQHLHWLRILS